MRVYFDTCSLQRPFDDRSQPRINVEAEAVLTILRLVESGQLEWMSSEVLQFEIDRIPDMERQARALELLELASSTLQIDDDIVAQAEQLLQSGVKPLDALHLASASYSKADFFCTCDDRILKKAKRLKGLNLRIVSPLQLVAEVTP
jgi:predicted nucleic acid-binding protein